MSSEMREIKAMADAVEYGIALGKLDAPAVFTKMRDLLNLALLARTEAAPVADGAVAPVACGKCGVRHPLQHSPDCGRSSGVVRASAFAKPGDIDCLGFEDGHTYPGIRRHEDEDHTLPLYTHPHDASGDAVTGRVNGYMFSARAIEIITDGEVPEWITKTPGLRVTITAMQAKEPAE